jgi:hypothetical protein
MQYDCRQTGSSNISASMEDRIEIPKVSTRFSRSSIPMESGIVLSDVDRHSVSNMAIAEPEVVISQLL